MSQQTSLTIKIGLIIRKGALSHDGDRYVFTPKAEYRSLFGGCSYIARNTLRKTVDVCYSYIVDAFNEATNKN